MTTTGLVDQILLSKNTLFIAFQSFFHGALFVILAISFFFYLSNKDKAFLYYGLYLLSSSFFFLLYFGLLQNFKLFGSLEFTHFWPSALIIPTFYLAFIRSLTELKSRSEKLDKWVYQTIKLNLGLFFMLLFFDNIITDNSILRSFLDVFLFLELLLIGFIFSRFRCTNDTVTKCYVKGTVFTVIFFLITLSLHHFIPPVISIALLQVGIVGSAIIYSIGLGLRYHEMQVYQSKDREEVIRQLENHKQFQDELKAQLSKEVEDKICELEYRNHRLSDLMTDLEKANKDLGQINYLASHDLKTPLRGISSIAEFLFKDYGNKLDEAGINNLVLLRDRVVKMDKMLDGLLFYNSAGKSFSGSEVRLKPLIESILKDLHLGNSVEVTNKIKHEVEIFDSKWLETIFKELIINSVQCIDKKYGRIEIDMRTVNGVNIYSVRDNGRGIALRNYKKIFDLFVTTDHRIKSRIGTGLSVVKKLVELYGGKIWVESKPGVGTVFYFTLYEMTRKRLQVA